VSQQLLCEMCQTEMHPVAPPFPPQICNSGMMSTVAMLNGHAECPKCHAKYVTQITGCQVQLGFLQIKEESRIVVPNGVPPILGKIKAG
jgi:hypothetical protein